MPFSALLLIGCSDTSEIEAEMRTLEARIDALEVHLDILSTANESYEMIY